MPPNLGRGVSTRSAERLSRTRGESHGRAAAGRRTHHPLLFRRHHRHRGPPRHATSSERIVIQALLPPPRIQPDGGEGDEIEEDDESVDQQPPVRGSLPSCDSGAPRTSLTLLFPDSVASAVEPEDSAVREPVCDLRPRLIACRAPRHADGGIHGHVPRRCSSPPWLRREWRDGPRQGAGVEPFTDPLCDRCLIQVAFPRIDRPLRRAAESNFPWAAFAYADPRAVANRGYLLETGAVILGAMRRLPSAPGSRSTLSRGVPEPGGRMAGAARSDG